MSTSDVLRRAKQRMESHGGTPDAAIWGYCGKNVSLFYRVRDILQRAGDFRSAIALAEAGE